MNCPYCGKELRPSRKEEDYIVCDDCRKKFRASTFAAKYGDNIEDDYEDDYEDYSETKRPRRSGQKLNLLLLISFVIGAIYMIYSLVYWTSTAGAGASTAEQIGSGIATVLVMPHLAFTFLAVLFNALGLFLKKRGFALTGAILYCVAIVMFPVYFMFVVIEAILSFIGFAKMKK